MEEHTSESRRVAHRLRESLRQGRSEHGRESTGATVRSAARLAVRSTRWMGRESGHLVRDAAEGVVHATGEVGGETRSFIKDAVIGVVEGTDQIIAVTKPAFREVVIGAVRGGNRAGMEAGQTGRDAVEGAILGAASIGIESIEAASAAVEGAAEALADAGTDLGETARVAMSGVVSGVSAAGGDVVAAVQDSAEKLIAYGVAERREVEEITDAAGDVVEAALEEAHDTANEQVQIGEIAAAAASGVVTAAYSVGQLQGDAAREEVVRTILRPRRDLAPEIQRQLQEAAEKLSRELPRGRATWRGAAIYRAGRSLFRAGAVDLAGSLAYFTLLSFFPLLALIIIVFAFFADPVTVEEKVLGVTVHYFPASADLFRETIESVINNSAAFGVVALLGTVFASTGLFRAATRGVNRAFRLEGPVTVRGTLAEGLVATLLGVLFVVSIGAAALFQAAIGLGGQIIQGNGNEREAFAIVLGTASAALPVGVTGVVFTLAYHYAPHLRVEWRDAAFGGMVAVILFEAGKHLFLWLTGLAAQNQIIYGPVASTVALLVWAYLAGLIFLYGAAVTKASAEIRPYTRP